MRFLSVNPKPLFFTPATRPEPMTAHNPYPPVKIGIVSISDRASSGVYEDKGLPALQEWLSRALKNPLQFEPRLIPTSKPPSAPP